MSETKTTEQLNAEFDAMTREQKQVAVASDALLMLNAGRLIAADGIYCHSASGRDFQDIAGEGATDLQQAFAKTACKVCAKGAIFVALVSRANHAPIRTFAMRERIDDELMVDRITDVFDEAQADLIEDCFEGFGVAGSFGDTYWNQFDDYDERLRAILENIIRNNGTFKPEQDVKQPALT